MLEQGPLSPRSGTPPPATNLPLPQSLLSGFRPAFCDVRSGEVRLCRTVDGELAEAHTFEHLPQEWVAECDGGGRPVRLRSEIRAGFLRGIDFWRLSDLLRPTLDA
ncbi:MAG: hypothetical protein J7D61_09225 [Marichromatium sp.]|nr:hypothetical protein [Marichromatium sp.]